MNLKFGGDALKFVADFGKFLREVFGGVPNDLVGILGGDWLQYRRLCNLASLKAKYFGHVERLGIREPLPPRLTLALPILQAAGDESQEVIQDLWARLLAAAMDPARASQVRQRFIETVKAMDPLDALLLRRVVAGSASIGRSQFGNVGNALGGVGEDEIAVSVEHLVDLNCMLRGGNVGGQQYHVSPFGREFMRIVGA
jgi:hypothetical protein